MDMSYMQYMNDVPSQIMQAMALDPANIPNFIAVMLCSTGGFLVYIWAIRLIVREKTDPYPLWLHCWMITWDIITTFTCIYLAVQTGGFWFFAMFSVFEPIWVVMEAICIHQSIKNQRQEEFGELVKGEVSVGQARFFAFGMIVTGFALNLWAFSMLGGPANGIWILCPFTNYVFAFWCWKFWRRRGAKTGTREGNSMGLQIIIAFEVSFMWIPGLSMWTALTKFNDQPFFYLIGIVASCVAVYNVYCCAKLPKKKTLPNGKKPVW